MARLAAPDLALWSSGRSAAPRSPLGTCSARPPRGRTRTRNSHTRTRRPECGTGFRGSSNLCELVFVLNAGQRILETLLEGEPTSQTDDFSGALIASVVAESVIVRHAAAVGPVRVDAAFYRQAKPTRVSKGCIGFIRKLTKSRLNRDKHYSRELCVRTNVGSQVLAAERHAHASHIDELISLADELEFPTIFIVIFRCDDKSQLLLHEESAFDLVRVDNLKNF